MGSAALANVARGASVMGIEQFTRSDFLDKVHELVVQ
jgi:hypothetical protein